MTCGEWDAGAMPASTILLEGGWAETWAFITGKRPSVALAGLSHPSRRALRMRQDDIFFPPIFSTEVAIEILAAVRHTALVTKLLFGTARGSRHSAALSVLQQHVGKQPGSLFCSLQ